MKRYLVVLTMAVMLQAQNPQPINTTADFPIGVNRYKATDDTTALTIQLPANSSTVVTLENTSIYCATSATATPSWNGTAATTTTLATIKTFGISKTSVALAFTDSNAGSGTAGEVFTIPDGGTFSFDMRMIQFSGSGPVQNFTWTTSGSCTITTTWREEK